MPWTWAGGILLELSTPEDSVMLSSGARMQGTSSEQLLVMLRDARHPVYRRASELGVGARFSLYPPLGDSVTAD